MMEIRPSSWDRDTSTEWDCEWLSAAIVNRFVAVNPVRIVEAGKRAGMGTRMSY